MTQIAQILVLQLFKTLLETSRRRLLPVSKRGTRGLSKLLVCVDNFSLHVSLDLPLFALQLNQFELALKLFLSEQQFFRLSIPLTQVTV